MRISLTGAALAAALLAPACAWADTAVGMHGEAFLVCSAGIDPATNPAPAPGAIDIGQLNEFCNDSGGYEVWLDYPAELASATLVVDGTAMTLPASGSVRVDSASGPAHVARSLRLQGGPSSGALSLTVRMQPAMAATTLTASN